MNNLIDELSAMIPACQPMPRKLDKLTVLRKAVQHLKALKSNSAWCFLNAANVDLLSLTPCFLGLISVGSSSGFTDTTHKPSFLPHDELRSLLLRVKADGHTGLVRFSLILNPRIVCVLYFNRNVSYLMKTRPPQHLDSVVF